MNQNIGTVAPVAPGKFRGQITTKTLDTEIALQAISSNNPQAPAFDIIAKSPIHGNWLIVGAVWEKSTKRDGTSFYAGQIEDDLLPTGILELAFFPQENGSMNVSHQPGNNNVVPFARAANQADDPFAVDRSYNNGDTMAA